MIKILSITLILFFSFLSTSFSAKDIKDFEKIDLSKDQKPGRFFEDQPDVTDEHQIHFIYLFLQMVKIENGISMEKWKKYF